MGNKNPRKRKANSSHPDSSHHTGYQTPEHTPTRHDQQHHTPSPRHVTPSTSSFYGEASLRDRHQQEQSSPSTPRRNESPVASSASSKNMLSWQTFAIILGLIIMCMLTSLMSIWLTWWKLSDLLALHLSYATINATRTQPIMSATPPQPTKWPEQEAAIEKIHILTEQVKQLEGGNADLAASKITLEDEVKEARRKIASSKETAQKSSQELLGVQESLESCVTDRGRKQILHAECEGDLSAVTARATQHEARLNSCREENSRLIAELASMGDLQSKYDDKEAQIGELKERCAAANQRIHSCETELENSTTKLETCHKELLMEEVMKNKLQELHKINYDLTTRNGELKKEVFRCEQDRSIYHIRMKEAEEELAKIREQPFQEETLE